MIRNLVIFSILIFSSAVCRGQILIKGTVLDYYDNTLLPGIVVTEKGTGNSVSTDLGGCFAITVKDSGSVLIFSCVAFVEREVSVKGQNELIVTLKEYATYEAWDQKISFYLNSGVINNPIGGEVDFSIPIFGGRLALKTIGSYQTDFKENNFINAGLTLKHIRLGYKGFGLDINSYYRRVLFDNGFDLQAFAFESFWHVRLFDLILGYTQIDLVNSDFSESDAGPGIVTGIQAWIPRPVSLSVLGKVSFYTDLREYQAEMKRSFGRVNLFMKYYHVDAFSELSVGFGFELTYYFRYQRNANNY